VYTCTNSIVSPYDGDSFTSNIEVQILVVASD